jgi:putative FmdB family regulatory protein
MPTYVYRCAKCGEQIEAFQSFADKPLTKHDECGGKLTKVLSAAGIVLKGSGFYKTDNRSSSRGGSKERTKESAGTSSSGSDSGSSGSGSGSSDSGSSSGSGSSDSGSSDSGSSSSGSGAKSGTEAKSA